MRPSYRIVVDGADITELIQQRLIKIDIEDNLGLVNDRFTMSIDDRDYEDGTLIPLIPHGVIVTIFLGYEKAEGVINPMDGLKPMGRFLIDEIMISRGSAGRAMTVTGRATDTNYSFVKKPQNDNGAWRNVTIGEIVTSIAKRNDFKPRIHEDFEQVTVVENQTNRSDADYLGYLADKYNAVFKTQAGYLYFCPPDKFDEVALPGLVPDTVVVHESDCEVWSFTYQGRSNFTGVRAKWKNKDKRASAYANSYVTEHPDQKEAWYEMSEEYASEEEAIQAVNAKKRVLDYQRAKFSMTGIGYPLLMAGSILDLKDFRQNTFPNEWRIVSSTHSFTNNGYMTSLDAEIKDAKKLETINEGQKDRNPDTDNQETTDTSSPDAVEDASIDTSDFGNETSENPFAGDANDFGSDSFQEASFDE